MRCALSQRELSKSANTPAFRYCHSSEEITLYPFSVLWSLPYVYVVLKQVTYQLLLFRL